MQLQRKCFALSYMCTHCVVDGPDDCEISVKSPVTVKVGSISPLIKCRSECYPSCTYKWTNASSGSSIVSANGDFEIDSVTRYLTGNYACECGNSATEIRTTHTEILQIIVWCKLFNLNDIIIILKLLKWYWSKCKIFLYITNRCTTLTTRHVLFIQPMFTSFLIMIY
jgi:hypothetical protein